jgi:AraC family transcriptional regulator
MAMAQVRQLLSREDISLHELGCTEPARRGRVLLAAVDEMVFVRRGMFVVGVNGHEAVASPHRLLVVPAGSEFTVEHPVEGGDDCLILRTTLWPFEELFGSQAAMSVHIATSATYLMQHRLRRASIEGAPALEVDHLVIELLHSIVSSVARARRTPTAAEQRAVRHAEEILAARFREDLPLGFLARSCGLSPSHLSRTFRRATGVTLHRYQNVLRLRAALRRIGEGERSLTSLALDLGYADHSHFTSAFRREYGFPPSAARPRESPRMTA